MAIIESENLKEAIEYFSLLDPNKAKLVDEEKSGVNTLGVVRLKDKSGNVLLRIKKDDVAANHEKLTMSLEEKRVKL